MALEVEHRGHDPRDRPRENEHTQRLEVLTEEAVRPDRVPLKPLLAARQRRYDNLITVFSLVAFDVLEESTHLGPVCPTVMFFRFSPQMGSTHLRATRPQDDQADVSIARVRCPLRSGRTYRLTRP